MAYIVDVKSRFFDSDQIILFSDVSWGAEFIFVIKTEKIETLASFFCFVAHKVTVPINATF